MTGAEMKTGKIARGGYGVARVGVMIEVPPQTTVYREGNYREGNFIRVEIGYGSYGQHVDILALALEAAASDLRDAARDLRDRLAAPTASIHGIDPIGDPAE